MSAPAPEVTIIIPTKDRPHWLPRTLLSALAQEAVSAEVVVVDDGSSPAVATSLSEAALSRVRLVRHERSGGVAAARNAGLAEARGEWVGFLDDDDLWAPGKLRLQLEAARGAGAHFAFASAVTVDASGTPLATEPAPRADDGLHRALLAANHIPGGCSNLVARTSLVRSVGGFDTDLSTLADWDLNIRLSAVGRAAVCSAVLVAYTVHRENMHQDDRPLEAELELLERKHGAARAELGVSVDREFWWAWRVATARMAGDSGRTAAAYWRLGRASRDPGALVRALAARIGGERLLGAGHRLRELIGGPAEPLAAPAWVAEVAAPPPDALRTVTSVA